MRHNFRLLEVDGGGTRNPGRKEVSLSRMGLALVFACGCFAVVFRAARAAAVLDEKQMQTIKFTDLDMQYLQIVPSRKLMMCALPEVGSVSLKAVLEDVHGSGADKALGMSKRDVANAVADESWTKVVFFRDPVSRFLSAYLDKCVRAWQLEDKHLMKRNLADCKYQFGTVNLTLAQAVGWMAIRKNPPNGIFRPQYLFCGLKRSLGHYQVVREFGDPAESRQNVRQLLRRMGIDNAESLPGFVKHFVPHGESVSNESASHWLCRYFRGLEVEFQALVYFYRGDYNLFNMTPPGFEDLCAGGSAENAGGSGQRA